ncbi:hypothetical protein [Dinghuibacter silviterrae]|uniref:Outer membrane protein with beta-barrel domain n=1 Tax=Dinghuibacter silviterrae TaxID=1539049 RepID=A0A4R8DMG4_9BACT|nr:hypothetical protein [Dinghuibacter silviterrae]TDW99179.1 hypothetical protein EDB95_0187 [Dinghuibacter silviterrae]
MKNLLLLVTLAAALGGPLAAGAQTTDSTRTDSTSSAAPAGSHWRTYRAETGPRRYRYNSDDDNGSFKQHLMVGGGLSLSFYSGEFLIGANPYVGYAFTKWLDAGVAINFQYYSESPEATYTNASYHNTLLGAGLFARVYPISFLFLQVQPERNEIWQKEFVSGQTTASLSYGVNSFLVGGGVKLGPPDSRSWGFISVLFDVGGSSLSPYNGPANNILPILRFGYNIGL